MSKKIKKLIKQTRHQLTWPVTIIHGGRTLQITSDPWTKTHRIDIPEKNVRDIEVLHEYGHAMLCETVHQMLSTHYFRPDPGPETLKLITPAAQAANDWFVDDWLFRLAPDPERAEIEESLNLLLSIPGARTTAHPDILPGLALMTAQAVKYCNRVIPLTGLLDQAVSALLAVNPAKPTTESIQAAVNGLMACYCDIRLTPVLDAGVWVWTVNDGGKK